MNLPSDFSFSQQNLQDYLDCPRRFELRYLEKLAWPAIRSEPVLELERRMHLGERFHQMVQQHQLGLPQETVASQATELELDEWWSSYLAIPPADLPSAHYPEITLVAPFEGYRLVAKFDLLAVEPGQKAVIVDWKTNRRPTPQRALRNRVQTRLYPFLLALAGAYLNGGQPIQPEMIEMVYWFTADPQNPVHFEYDEDIFEADRTFLAQTIHQIEAQTSPFLLTSDEKMCLYCTYRSLCDRGTAAGKDPEGETVDQEPLLIDFDQIAEIEF